MTVPTGSTPSPVFIKQTGRVLSISLNRPQAINSLNLEMIRLLQAALEIARKEARDSLSAASGRRRAGFLRRR